MTVRGEAVLAVDRKGSIIERLADFHNCTIAFWVGPWVVTTYAFFAGAAFFAGCIVFLWFCSMAGCDPVRMARLQILITLPLALIGLRVFSVLTEIRKLLERPLQTIVHPGYMLHGGIAGGTLAMAIIAHRTGQSFLLYMDGAVMAITLGEAIARVGCHVYGCCWGRPTRWLIGIRYSSKHASVLRNEPHLAHVKLHPAQLYSAVFAFLLWVAIMLACPHRRFDGMLTLIYCLIHPIGRFGLERLRQDNRGRLWGKWTHTHLYSLAIFVFGLVVWIRAASLTLTPLHLDVGWADVLSNVSVLEWVLPFSMIFFFAYGVHYKAVGSWIHSTEET